MKQLPAPVYAEYGRVGYGIIVQGLPKLNKKYQQIRIQCNKNQCIVSNKVLAAFIPNLTKIL